MRSSWSYSLLMLVTYVTLFVYWKFFPSRVGFVLGGCLALGVLVLGYWRAWRRGYFTNRVDACLHAYVILDVCLETASFEAFRWAEPFAVVSKFHDNNNFLGCTLAFTLLLGGYRWFALQTTIPSDRRNDLWPS